MTEAELARIELQVGIASAYELLVWGGDDWPQPHPLLSCGTPPWDWPRIAEAAEKRHDGGERF